jgi:iron complex transport system substrate-binding protein
MGETEITRTPKRIIALEWIYAEDLLALGVQPVGVADIAFMNKWVQMKELSLSPDVVDVGTRNQPNLEKISQLDPDLIIGVKLRHQAIYDDLSAIAPTVIFDPYPAGENPDHLTLMKQELMTIADIVNRRDAGVAAIERMDSSFERAAQKLSATGAKEEFLVVQAFTSVVTDAAEMRIFTENSIPAQVMSRLGFENAWDVKYELYGFSEVGLEALADVDHANFFYVVQDDDNVFANEWDNPVWQNLQFAKEGRTYALGGDTWLFGGPISAEIFAEKVTEALADNSES